MIQKTLNEVVQNIITHIHDALPMVDTKEGTFIRDVFINPVSDEFAAMYGDMKLLENIQSVLTATGDDLENLAANYFIERKRATPSFGKIRFYIRGTNKSSFTDIDNANIPNEISISMGKLVCTLSSLLKEPIEFKITESIQIVNIEDIKSLPIDANNGYRYIELTGESVLSGSFNNVGPGEIIQQIQIDTDIAFISNPYNFTGGSDQEDDTSLALRINLALSGANIGTKNGYLSYILKQKGVIDAKIVGAGDLLMRRDGGYFDNITNKYVSGSGGMVDIWVRGQLNAEETTYLSLSNEDIILPTQPINSIISATIKTNTGLNIDDIPLVNASDYEVEIRQNTKPDGTSETYPMYYKDILWDFSITTDFVDKDFYPLPSYLTISEIEELKRSLDAELLKFSESMINLNYGINWSLVNISDLSESQPILNLFSYNGDIIKLEAKNSLLSKRTFVKKDDRIYLRAYGKPRKTFEDQLYTSPDFILIKDNSHTGHSVKAKDKIRWINFDQSLNYASLEIKYNYDALINDIQKGIESVRILTADVLIKQAQKVPVEIILEATCYPEYNPATVKKQIISRIVTYVDSIKKMGGNFDRSDIIAVARQTEGVESINIDTVIISKIGNSMSTNRVEINDNEYLKVENIIIDVYPIKETMF